MPLRKEKYLKEVLTQNFTAEIASGIDSREHAYIIYQTWTANIAWKIFYMNIEVRVCDPALYATPCIIEIIQSDLKVTPNFRDITTAAELRVGAARITAS